MYLYIEFCLVSVFTYTLFIFPEETQTVSSDNLTDFSKNKVELSLIGYCPIIILNVYTNVVEISADSVIHHSLLLISHY